MPFSTRASSQDGFTLVEVLVVVLILSVLAGIALPAFLSQREKAQDTDAKDHARNLYSQLQACYSEQQSYTGCVGDSDVGSGLPVGDGAGEVEINSSDTGVSTFLIVARSRSGGEFRIRRASANAPVARECSGGTAGCRGTSW